MITEIPITMASSAKPSTCFSYSPPTSILYPGGSERANALIFGIRGSSTPEDSTPSSGKAETVTVRNWFRRWSFSVSSPYSIRETSWSGTFCVPCEE